MYIYVYFLKDVLNFYSILYYYLVLRLLNATLHLQI